MFVAMLHKTFCMTKVDEVGLEVVICQEIGDVHLVKLLLANVAMMGRCAWKLAVAD